MKGLETIGTGLPLLIDQILSFTHPAFYCTRKKKPLVRRRTRTGDASRQVVFIIQKGKAEEDLAADVQTMNEAALTYYFHITLVHRTPTT